MKNVITIVGLGAGDLDQLPVGIYRKLKAVEKCFVRTENHPVVAQLKAEGMTYTSFDDIYEAHDQFHDVYEAICHSLLKEAENGPIVYAVPGHPLVAEATVQLLLEHEKNGVVDVHIAGGQSFLDPLFASLKIDPIDGFQLLDGTSLQRDMLQIHQHMIIAQVYDQLVASEVKLTLMEKLPDDYPVKIVTAAGTSGERMEAVPLYELDRAATLNNLTAVYVPPVTDEALLAREFSRLRHVIAELRGPDGCPWDKEQTHPSLKKYLLEEAYEVLEAIDEGDDDHLVEELGDVLLQVMLHAQIGEDDGVFTIEDIIETLTEKMIRRHPHVFGDATAGDAEKVVAQWEEIKREEKGEPGEPADFPSILAGIPSSLPSLAKADKIQRKAAKVGFDWNDEAPMWMKLQEELAEWLQETRQGNAEAAAKELGDVLFVFVNLARFHGIDPEEALRQTNEKFIRRFQYIEKRLYEAGKNAADQSLETLDALWNEAKQVE
ncbi:tetrapyrrole methylase family protein / MazG family protein [Evansella caseinilytica]|uniref:Tetrapyrrole methylase family protein / MazG family protein n=1 Tax=Evansella caseinilytica TaxID=1503961 RepID=A0A1H3UVC2_9BACI|nr:nucleoside triphosphate pyrophosphohydrolase [Evansella caseinilytica]SDZ66400.1 tetrapyrrole methylase family protein / MazG family protein [Evansella caseinilytica]